MKLKSRTAVNLAYSSGLITAPCWVARERKGHLLTDEKKSDHSAMFSVHFPAALNCSIQLRMENLTEIVHDPSQAVARISCGWKLHRITYRGT